MVGNETYIASANKRNGHSYLYRFNESAVESESSELLVKELTIATDQAQAWESFVVRDETYLAVANIGTSASRLYRFADWVARMYRNCDEFGPDPECYYDVVSTTESVQDISITHSFDWESFVVRNVTYLALASRSGDISRLYRFDDELAMLVRVQDIATNFAHDWESFVVSNVTYLAVANRFGGISMLYRFDETAVVSGSSELLVWVQNITTNKASDWESFEVRNETYLAVANIDAGISRLYRFNESAVVNGSSELLVWVQDIATSIAYDWESFVVSNVMYLAVANFDGGISRLYRFDESAAVSGSSELLVCVQNITTNGAYSWGSFDVRNETYLVVGNEYGTSSTLYRMLEL